MVQIEGCAEKLDGCEKQNDKYDSLTTLAFQPNGKMCQHHCSSAFIDMPISCMISGAKTEDNSSEENHEITSCVKKERKVSTITFDVPSPTFDMPSPITAMYDESTSDDGYRRQRFIQFNLDNTGQSSTLSKLKDEIKVDPASRQKCDSHAIKNDSQNIDGGWAWMVLIGGALNHVIADGIISSIGIFILTWQEQFSESLSSISWPLTLFFCVAYIAGPIGSALCKSFSIRQVAMGGTILSTIAFAAASYSSTLWHLYVTFSAAGLGFALTIQPTSVVLAYYFDRFYARANGVSFAGVGVGVFILPPLFQYLIDEYGWQSALFIIAAISANMGLCAALYRPTPLEIANRQQSDTPSDSTKDDNTSCSKRNSCCQFLANIADSFDYTLFKDFKFCFLVAAKFFYGLSYVIVIFYTPVRAVHAGMSNINAAMLVSVIGISSFVSRLTHGYIIDYKILTATGFTSMAFFVCSAGCVINPLIDSYEGLIVLNLVIGLSSGVFNSTVPIVAKEYVGLEKISGGVGLIHLMIGAGVTLGSYKASILYDLTGSYDIPFYVAGSGFMLCSIFICAKPVSEYMTKGEDDDAFVSPWPVRDLVGADNVAVELDHVDEVNSVRTISDYVSTKNDNDCTLVSSTSDGLHDTMPDSGCNGVYLGDFAKDIEC